MTDTVTEHPGDLLSAVLDGQVGAGQAAVVRAHVRTCAECAAELDAVRAARRVVRELPAVEPPPAFLAELLAGDDVVPFGARRADRPSLARRAALAANLLGSAAAGVLLLLATSGGAAPSPVAPVIPTAVEKHVSTVSALEAGGVITRAAERYSIERPAPPTTAERRAVDDLPAPFAAPTELAGYVLVEGFESDRGVHLLYRRGGYGLSIFELEGAIDWDDLPAQGTKLDIGGDIAWRWDDDDAGGRVLLVERGDMVVLLVGDEPGDAVLDVARALPTTRPNSLGTRLKQSLGRALELLAP